MGSGTTAMVSKSLGRHYIGCELHKEYGELIDNRISEYNKIYTAKDKEIGEGKLFLRMNKPLPKLSQHSLTGVLFYCIILL